MELTYNEKKQELTIVIGLDVKDATLSSTGKTYGLASGGGSFPVKVKDGKAIVPATLNVNIYVRREVWEAIAG